MYIVVIAIAGMLLGCEKAIETEIPFLYGAAYSTDTVQIVDLSLLFESSSLVDFAFIDNEHILLLAAGIDSLYTSVYHIESGLASPPIPALEQMTGEVIETLCQTNDLDLFDLETLLHYQSGRLSADSKTELTVMASGRLAVLRDIHAPKRTVVFDASLWQLFIQDIAFLSEERLLCSYQRSIPMPAENMFPMHLIELVGWYNFDAWTRSRVSREINYHNFIADFSLDSAEVEDLYLQAFGSRLRGYALIELDADKYPNDCSLHLHDIRKRLLPLGREGILMLPSEGALQYSQPQVAAFDFINPRGDLASVILPESITYYSGAVDYEGNTFACFSIDPSGTLLPQLEIICYEIPSLTILFSAIVDLPPEIKYPLASRDEAGRDMWDGGARLSPGGKMLALKGEQKGKECLVVIKN